jgi:hypothetical protein
MNSGWSDPLTTFWYSFQTSVAHGYEPATTQPSVLSLSAENPAVSGRPDSNHVA